VLITDGSGTILDELSSRARDPPLPTSPA